MPGDNTVVERLVRWEKTMNLSDSDGEILVRMIGAYRKALADRLEMRKRKRHWDNQRCACCGVTAEMHGSKRENSCEKFVWSERCFEAADAANRKIEWLAP